MPSVPVLHPWDLDTGQARGLQLELAGRVDVTRPLGEVARVGGADVSYDLGGKWLYGAVVVTRAGTEEVLERSGFVTEAQFPYVPGLFSFREAPALIRAYEALGAAPDVLLLDGQGIAHPRGIGLAATWACGWESPPSAAPSPDSSATTTNPGRHVVTGRR